MPTGTIILLGAFAGFTIYLGLPLAFLKRISTSTRAFLSMLATGVLVFLLYDILSKASEPIGDALGEVRKQHTGTGNFLLDLLLLAVGVGLGSVGLVYFNKYVFERLQVRKQLRAEENALHSTEGPSASIGVQEIAAAEAGVATISAAPPVQHTPKTSTHTTRGEIAPRTLALLIATGIGLHNFSEGLAIGQSAATGALQLAIVLIVGFGLHNMTEGFGIAGPLSGQTTSWKFVALLGLIGGGPTFLGTIIGMLLNSPQIFIFFLALAAGAIIYVLGELFGVARRLKAPEIAMWGLLLGFLLGYATDLLVTFAGA